MDKLFWSTRPIMKSVKQEEAWVKQLRQEIVDTSNDSIESMNTFLSLFDGYREFLNVDVETAITSIVGTSDDISGKKKKSGDDDDDDEQFEFDVRKLQQEVKRHREEIELIKSDIPLQPIILNGFFSVNTEPIRKMLITKHTQIADGLLEGLSQRLANESKAGTKEFQSWLKTISQTPSDIEHLAEIHEFIEGMPNKIQSKQEVMARMTRYSDVLAGFQFQAVDAIKAKWKLLSMPKKISEQIEISDEIILEKKKEYAAEQLDEQSIFEQTLSALESEVQSFASYTDIKRVDMVTKHVQSVRQKLQDAKTQASTYNSREALFDLDITEYHILGNIERVFEPYETLWNTSKNWIEREGQLYTDSFTKINGEEIEDEIDTFYKSISKAFKQFTNMGMDACVKIASQIRDKVTEFKPNVPLIQGLRNKGIRQRHLDELSDKIGKQIVINEKFTLRKAVDMGLMDFNEEVAKAGERAGKEYQIEKALDEMEEEWNTNELVKDLRLLAYKSTGTFVLSGYDDLVAVLDEQITMTQAMQFSAFKKPFEERIENWDTRLNLMSEVLESWMEVQRGWLYLQPIFDSDDIMKQLPTEGKRFKTVDKNWRQEMLKGTRKPAALQFCANERLFSRVFECFE